MYTFGNMPEKFYSKGDRIKWFNENGELQFGTVTCVDLWNDEYEYFVEFGTRQQWVKKEQTGSYQYKKFFDEHA